MLTVAALLPQHWVFTLVDLNVRPLQDAEWQAADIICTGGMIPQQNGILELIDRANRDGKYIVVGGPDPTSQPDIYVNADARVLGEGEITIPMWISAWRAGNPCGQFETPDKPDVTCSPTPRFDLVDFKNYLQAGIQISRGCPFNCEFCDIIELYGRIPRSKNVHQVLAELDRLSGPGLSRMGRYFRRQFYWQQEVREEVFDGTGTLVPATKLSVLLHDGSFDESRRR